MIQKSLDSGGYKFYWIAEEVSYFVCITFFWNNLPQVGSYSKDCNRDVQNRPTCRTEGADFNKVRLFVNHWWTWCLTEIFQQKGPISFDLHRTWQREHNIGIGYGSELIWQWKIDLSCPFTIHKHEINFSFRLIAVLFSN
jgi:hypothetical protein